MSSNIVILDFLTNEAGLDVASAAASVVRFQQAGHVTADDLWSLTNDELKEIVADSGMRRRIQAALKRGPASQKTSSRKKSKLTVQESKEASISPPADIPEDEICANTYKVNRSPVMILWTAVVAYSTGFRWEEALSLASVVAGLNAKAKAESIWGQSSARAGGDVNTFCVDGPQVNFPTLISVSEFQELEKS
jgi:hypothetical protein